MAHLHEAAGEGEPDNTPIDREMASTPPWMKSVPLTLPEPWAYQLTEKYPDFPGNIDPLATLHEEYRGVPSFTFTVTHNGRTVFEVTTDRAQRGHNVFISAVDEKFPLTALFEAANRPEGKEETT